MDIVVEQRAPTTVVRITGSVDGLTVSYTSSAGLRALLATVKQARSAGGDFRLAGVLPPVHKVLEMSGFTTILKLYTDVDGAVASYPA